MRYYLSGPMTGYPDFNFDTFDAVAASVRSTGHDVWNPAEADRLRDPDIETRRGFSEGTPLALPDWYEIIKEDVRAVTECDAILMLPGWEDSRGALVEKSVAEDCGIPVYYAEQDLDDDWFVVGKSGPLIVGLSGYGQTGKDTAGAIFQRYGFKRLAFADVLRDMLYALDPRVRWGSSSAPLRELIDIIGWERAKKESPDVRPLLQRLGTEGGRALLGDTVWVDATLAGLQPGGRYVITDVRFPNEAEAIEKAGGRVWRVERWSARRGEPATKYGPANDHPSETALDEWPFSTLLINVDEQQDEYERSVARLLVDLGWDR